MMNNPAKIDPEFHRFVTKDRIRLFTERNEFKRLAEQYEQELYDIQERSKKLISFLLCLCTVLLGVLAYVLSNS
ncbi:hypothetical protein [Acinetobacter tandoii]|uniref:Uncharacterized protein n=1 Tax=Acinetobacter tandoii DSM 14970 = CIP 107469 TaxID=1120927 RepID=R9AYK1_9GAMM|nr:hypothetical protein [Acinetobacter tandoii]EOR07252.1 hypothetical protein I593_02139 [Acinetobacter tandoii DSM 14970 = CIP 107469]